jgi:DMSO/TMAO reductase YedYZ molybdopterin-dependent catalytic subunit
MRAKLEPSGPFHRHPLRPHQLVERSTPTNDAIVLCHLGVPRIAAEDWSLTIDGLVQRPSSLKLDDLMQRPRVEFASVHQCCGSPLRPEVPTRRVCNVVWAGARLADLLADCRPQPGARFVWSSGADHGSFQGETCEAYVKDLPLDRVAADVLIAYLMNGEPLRAEHGFPARLIVPGYYGTNSVKWLTTLTLAATRASSPFTTRWYNDPVRDASGKATGDFRPVWSVAPESLIVEPVPAQAMALGEPAHIWGWAWADGGITAVDVSADGGTTWTSTNTEPAAGWAWQRFSATWRPDQRGNHQLCSRAYAADGSSQPAAGRRNAIHCVPGSVV